MNGSAEERALQERPAQVDPEAGEAALSATVASRQERLKVTPSPGEHNSLWYWQKTVGRRRVYKNYILMRLARGSPSLAFKNWLYRRMGMKVGEHVSVGLEAAMDIFFPQLITIEDDVIIGYSTTILCHEYLNREYRTGPVVIGRGAVVGAKCLILPGVRIAPGAVVSAMSLVNRDVDGFVGGVPIRPLRGAASGRGDAAAGDGK